MPQDLTMEELTAQARGMVNTLQTLLNEANQRIVSQSGELALAQHKIKALTPAPSTPIEENKAGE
jgi:hypothetical protein